MPPTGEPHRVNASRCSERTRESAVIEIFNGKLRDECLNANGFLTPDNARGLIECWTTDYNGWRPHSTLGNIFPGTGTRQS
jgi:hypothetical protein